MSLLMLKVPFGQPLFLFDCSKVATTTEYPEAAEHPTLEGEEIDCTCRREMSIIARNGQLDGRHVRQLRRVKQCIAGSTADGLQATFAGGI